MYLFWLVPVITLLAGLGLYKFIGKAKILRFDAVQFLYAFILAPLLFVWVKVMLNMILRSDFAAEVSLNQLFVYDTLVSLIMLFMYAFVVIHSLTKTFSVNKRQDSLYDFFHDSEFFHLWLTHIIIFGGGVVLATLLGSVNAFLPMDLVLSRPWFYFSLAVGLVVGWLSFGAVWLADPKQKVAPRTFTFMRLIKIITGGCFMVLVTLFFTADISFTASHIVYWWVLVVVSAQVMIALFMYKSVTAHSFLERFFNRLKHQGWNFRVQLFKK